MALQDLLSVFDRFVPLGWSYSTVAECSAGKTVSLSTGEPGFSGSYTYERRALLTSILRAGFRFT
jgi:hypothetical protein